MQLSCLLLQAQSKRLDDLERDIKSQISGEVRSVGGRVEDKLGALRDELRGEMRQSLQVLARSLFSQPHRLDEP